MAESEKSVAKTSDVIVIEQPLDSFLTLVGNQFGVHVKLPRKFKGTIRNMKLPGELDPMLGQLSSKFGFDWYREANTIHITSRARSVSMMIYLGNMSFKSLTSALEKADVRTKGFKMAHIPASNSLLINAPASLIAKIELLAEGYNKNVKGLTVIRYGSSS